MPEPGGRPAAGAAGRGQTLTPVGGLVRFGRVRLGQVAAAEVALALLLAFVGNLARFVGAILLAAVLLALVFGRYGRDLWFVECLAPWRRLRRLARQAASAAPIGPPGPSGLDVSTWPAAPDSLALLRELVPEFTVRAGHGSRGEPVGVGCDGAGWFAVLGVAVPDGAGLPLELLVQADEVRAVPATVQVVAQSRHARERDDSPCAESYRALLRRVGAPAQIEQAVWVAVRVSALACADLGLADPAAVPDLVAATARRVGLMLRRAGFGCELLGGDDLVETLAEMLDPRPAAAPPGARLTSEGWGHWNSAGLAHTTFWVSGWPDAEAASVMLAELHTVGAPLIATTMILEPRGETTEVVGLLRVAGEGSDIEAICAAVRLRAAARGARLRRLDGEHGPAVYASLPTGGGKR